MKRQVILVPRPVDLTESHRQYWDNFVWTVRHALEKAGCECEILEAKAVAEVLS